MKYYDYEDNLMLLVDGCFHDVLTKEVYSKEETVEMHNESGDVVCPIAFFKDKLKRTEGHLKTCKSFFKYAEYDYIQEDFDRIVGLENECELIRQYLKGD